MITFEDFSKVMSFNLEHKCCIEIEFYVKGNDAFMECWMGKSPDKSMRKDLYWFGLTPDGENVFDYPTFQELSTAKVFGGKSLLEFWDSIEFISIDGCDPMERVRFYVGEKL